MHELQEYFDAVLIEQNFIIVYSYLNKYLKIQWKIIVIIKAL